MSHACGTGSMVRDEIVKLMLLFKIHALSLGNSGVQVETVQRLIDFYNEEIYPVVYEIGSLGASGDLAPLAHLVLPLLGMGEVICNGEQFESKAFRKMLDGSQIILQKKIHIQDPYSFRCIPQMHGASKDVIN